MPRYVDLDKLPKIGLWRDPEDHGAMVELRDVIQALQQAAAETGEVAEVVHAHWIGSGENVRCSCCKMHPLKEMDVDCVYYWSYEPPFCPNCGAKMDEEEEDNDMPQG